MDTRACLFQMSPYPEHPCSDSDLFLPFFISRSSSLDAFPHHSEDTAGPPSNPLDHEGPSPASKQKPFVPQNCYSADGRRLSRFREELNDSVDIPPPLHAPYDSSRSGSFATASLTSASASSLPGPTPPSSYSQTSTPNSVSTNPLRRWRRELGTIREPKRPDRLTKRQDSPSDSMPKRTPTTNSTHERSVSTLSLAAGCEADPNVTQEHEISPEASAPTPASTLATRPAPVKKDKLGAIGRAMKKRMKFRDSKQ